MLRPRFELAFGVAEVYGLAVAAPFEPERCATSEAGGLRSDGPIDGT